MRLANDPLRPSDLVEPDQYKSTRQEPTLKDYFDSDSDSSAPVTTTEPSDVDGELPFPSLSQ